MARSQNSTSKELIDKSAITIQRSKIYHTTQRQATAAALLHALTTKKEQENLE